MSLLKHLILYFRNEICCNFFFRIHFRTEKVFIRGTKCLPYLSICMLSAGQLSCEIASGTPTLIKIAVKL